MARFRKKPVVVEAVQFNVPIDVAGLQDFLEGHDEWHLDSRGLVITTLEGEMLANPSDWIIKGVAGEIYPCKPEIFERTYEPVPPMTRIDTGDARHDLGY